MHWLCWGGGGKLSKVSGSLWCAQFLQEKGITSSWGVLPFPVSGAHIPTNPLFCHSKLLLPIQLGSLQSQPDSFCLPVHLCLLHKTKRSIFNTKSSLRSDLFWRQWHYVLLYVALPKEPSLVLIPHKTLQGRDDLDRLWRVLSTSDPLWECWQRGLAVPVKMNPFSSLWENDFCKRRTHIHKVMCFLFYSLCPQIKSHREASSTLKASQAELWLPRAVCSEIGVTIHLLVISPA